ncbi:MAG: hypothetical protein ACLQSX_11160 [Smithella sp.]
MKKIFACFIMMMFLVGCAGVSVQAPNANNVQAAGKAIGVLVLAKYPAIASQALPYAKVFLSSAQSGAIDSATMTTAVNLLLKQCNADAEIKAAIDVGMAFLNIQITTGTVSPELVALLTGFVQGITPENTSSLKNELQKASHESIREADYLTKLDMVAIKKSMKGYGG